MLNDLEATALGIESLDASRIFTLNEGDDVPNGNRGLIAAGTGRGMAGLLAHEGRYFPVASEGGHVDFAPRTPLEVDLLVYLRARFGRVSYERIVSGPGLVNVFGFLRDTRGGSRSGSAHGRDPRRRRGRRHLGEEPAPLAESGLAVDALEMFASVYGAMAGNLALMMVATGGLYVGGGIAPKILDKLREGAFMRAFVDKGRFTPLLEKIPVRVILDDKTALHGAARAAVR